MLKRIWAFSLLLSFASHAQVVDVDGDKVVGPEEAIALAEEWKGAAAAANAHHHLGQTWSEIGSPLILRGNFPGGSIFPFKDKQVLPIPTRPAAPLVLDNTATGVIGGRPDLIVAGPVGRISAIDRENSELFLEANRRVFVNIDLNYDDSAPDDGQFVVMNRGQTAVMTVTAGGDLFLTGGVQKKGGSRTLIDHPLDPNHKVLVHASVESPEMKNVYDGVAVLDDRGEAVVDLPGYFEALNGDFRYQLTALGSPGPNLYIADEIEGNRFRIAGGAADQKVSWMVTGVRRDTYAKAHPIVVEELKSSNRIGAISAGMEP